MFAYNRFLKKKLHDQASMHANFTIIYWYLYNRYVGKNGTFSKLICQNWYLLKNHS